MSQTPLDLHRNHHGFSSLLDTALAGMGLEHWQGDRTMFPAEDHCSRALMHLDPAVLSACCATAGEHTLQQAIPISHHMTTNYCSVGSHSTT